MPDTEKSREGEVVAVTTGKTLENGSVTPLEVQQGERRLCGTDAKSRVAVVIAAAVVLVWGTIHAPGLASGDPASQPLVAAVSAAATPTPRDQVYAKLPMRFEANRGQSDPAVQFLSRGPGYSLFLTSAEAVLVLSKMPEHRDTADHLVTKDQFPIEKATSTVLRMGLRGANAQPQVSGEAELPGKSNYFIGSDPTKWRTNVPNYAKVRYSEVYKGIDVIYYGNGRQLEYDFVVAPGADPGAIRLAFQGSQRTAIDRDGDLVLATEADGAEVRMRKPVVYQIVSGSRQEVPAEYVLLEAHEVGFTLGRYDAGEPLVIDPVVLSYSTFLGGSGFDAGQGIAVDGSGNVYVTGQTTSPNFPTAHPLPYPFPGGGGDAFVVKLDPSCSVLLYSTYLGGSADDRGWGIAVDNSGNAYVTGITASSTTFPLVNAFQSVYGGGPYDVFVTKLNPAGSVLLYSTYLGGSADDNGYGIAVDSVGDAYVTGLTGGNFPLMNASQSVYGGGLYDAFVAKLHPAGSGAASLVYSTYLGGNSTDIGRGIAVDGSGDAYVTGATQSTNFPLMNPLQPATGGANDAFVAKLARNAGGFLSLVYSTYLGGSNDDQGLGIAVDGSGNAYVTGRTQSTNFPLANAFQSVYGGGATDAFVAMLNAAGSAPLVYSTYLGGNNNDIGYGIAVDGSGNAYVTGTTQSTNFPPVPDAQPFQATYAGNGDAFVAMLVRNATGPVSLVYSTYLGGNSTDDAYAIAVDGLGNAYVTGTTFSSNFPTAQPFQAANAGGGDAFIAKITALPGCQVILNQTTFAPGSTITVVNTQVTNPGPERWVEFKFWIDLPGGGTYSVARGGEDGPPFSNAPPPGNDMVMLPVNYPGPVFYPPFSVGPVTTSFPPRGAYSFNCRLENPVTGQDFVVGKTPFLIVP